jgi:hypothetical protein
MAVMKADCSGAAGGLQRVSTTASCYWAAHPVSWLSTKVQALLGHQPRKPGGLPSGSISRQYSVFFTASCGGSTPGLCSSSSTMIQLCNQWDQYANGPSMLMCDVSFIRMLVRSRI